MATEHDSLLGERKSPRAETLTTLFQSPSTEGSSTLVPTFKEEQGTNAVPISYKNGIEATAASAKETKKPARSFIALADCSTMAATLTGSFVFLTYHVVFCLTQAATIAPTPRATGLLARAAALGTLTAAPVFVYNLGSEIPAIYPASDLFLAPFLAELAYKIQAALDDMGLGDNDEYFLATFLFVSGFGMVLSGCCCILAARFKLANLGAFLPYSVLCGFFTTIGFLMYSLSVVVDTGLKIGQIVTCNDMDVIGNALLHHIPSLIVGITMHVLGRKFPSLVILLIFATILGAYVILWITSTTLQEAQEAKWFFSVDDLVPAANNNDGDSHGSLYGPPMPFGLLFSIWRGSVIWKAAFAGTPTILALVFLYVIRSSLHSAALRKNIPNVTRKVAKNSSERAVDVSSPTAREEKKRRRKRKKEVLALGNILESGYAYSQLAAALFGGITVAPSIAASLTMFQLGAERSAPQYGSFALLFIFYLTDFSPAQCCPKPAFSCLMVLAGLDMSRTWIVGSFFKTKDKFEWAVAPFLVVMAFTVGMLNAILLGVAMSTFIFAANFYRAGTVKFVGSGITLRAPVERRQKELAWLDQNADLTQILILQNYLFFGNAQSVQNYVTTMFDDDDLEDVGDGEQFTNEDFPLPPVPKILIVDFALVTGMDTSAVDLFREIVALCNDHHCKLFLSGVNPNLRSVLIYAGIKRTNRTTIYLADLETALGKAEDELLSDVLHVEEKEIEESQRRGRSRSMSDALKAEDGFVYALSKIEEQHGVPAAKDLADFGPHTTPISLLAGEVLVRDSRNPGIYFVESGLLRVKHATGRSTMSLSTATATSASTGLVVDPGLSIGHLNARTTTLGRKRAAWKKDVVQRKPNEQTFRLARVGQGWVIGSIQAATANEIRSHAGVHVAETDCLLHFLPYKCVLEMETEKPALAMALYKLMSLLATKRQESTIQQLDQLVKILNTPTPRLGGGGKRELAKLQQM